MLNNPYTKLLNKSVVFIMEDGLDTLHLKVMEVTPYYLKGTDIEGFEHTVHYVKIEDYFIPV